MKKTERQAVDEFVALVGGKSWKRISRACRGDWRGTTDYGFVMDDRVTFFVSNGMDYFEMQIREWMEDISFFQEKKNEYFRLLHAQVEKDNANAIAEGLHNIKLLDIGILSPECNIQHDFFAPYALVEIDGRRFKHHTSAFASAGLSDNFDAFLDKSNREEIFTAGAVKAPDYIFCGARFSSEDRLYKIG